jgi:CRISPR-associated protein (TIGR02710 family)
MEEKLSGRSQAFMPAANLLENARKAADEDSIKRTLSTLHQLCEGYGLWDRFQHKEAAQRIENTLKNANDLQAMFSSNHSDLVIRTLKQHRKALQELIDRPRSRATIADLLGNAKRRQRELRYDDGVARLYRAIEAIAQVALGDRHGIQSTDNVPLESVPEPLRQRWKSRSIDGKLVLGLQDAYELLDARGDDLGRTFKNLKLHDPQHSPLTARNQSILAHGFQPVGADAFGKLWNATIELGCINVERDLPVFPRMTNANPC